MGGKAHFWMKIFILCLAFGMISYPGLETGLRAEPTGQVSREQVNNIFVIQRMTPVFDVVAQASPSQPSTPAPSEPPTTLQPPTSTPVQPSEVPTPKPTPPLQLQPSPTPSTPTPPPSPKSPQSTTFPEKTPCTSAVNFAKDSTSNYNNATRSHSGSAHAANPSASSDSSFSPGKPDSPQDRFRSCIQF